MERRQSERRLVSAIIYYQVHDGWAVGISQTPLTMTQRRILRRGCRPRLPDGSEVLIRLKFSGGHDEVLSAYQAALCLVNPDIATVTDRARSFLERNRIRVRRLRHPYYDMRAAGGRVEFFSLIEEI